MAIPMREVLWSDHWHDSCDEYRRRSLTALRAARAALRTEQDFMERTVVKATGGACEWQNDDGRRRAELQLEILGLSEAAAELDALIVKLGVGR